MEKLYVLQDEIVVLPGRGKGSILGVDKKEYREFAAEYPDLFPPIPDAPPPHPQVEVLFRESSVTTMEWRIPHTQGERCNYFKY